MKRILLILTTILILLLPVSWAEAADYYAATDGSGTTCDIGTPCTLDYAVETKATAGDTVYINDGTYSIGQLVVPAGVSLVSTVGAGHAVLIQPNVSLGVNDPFILLSTASPGSAGNQTISYLEFNGVNGANVARVGIQVQNRNDVRIHHCNIHDFKGYDWNSHGVKVKSTQVGATDAWWLYWPADAQAPGTDTNINALWPTNPVENFELDNNTITDCGKSDPQEAGGVYIFNLKNSTIHDNTISSPNVESQAIKSCAAILDNVDIYNNDLSMGAYDATRSSYIIEIWIMKGGCQIYNNTANAAFSITYGKETQIYNNEIIFNPAAPVGAGDIGIEFIGQSHGQIYQNFVSGTNSAGIVVGIESNANAKSWIVEYVTVKNNIVYNSNAIGIYVKGEGGSLAVGNNTARYIYI